MPTEDVHQTITKFFDLKKQGGAVSALSIFVGTIYLLLKLPPDQVRLLREYWWIITIPSVLVLFSWMFSAYISEMKTRTSIEEKTQASITTLTDNIKQLSDVLVSNFDKLSAYHMDDKMYYDRRIDSIEDHLRNIYTAMEKRADYRPGKDTEKFLKQEN